MRMMLMYTVPAALHVHSVAHTACCVCVFHLPRLCGVVHAREHNNLADRLAQMSMSIDTALYTMLRRDDRGLDGLRMVIRAAGITTKTVRWDEGVRRCQGICSDVSQAHMLSRIEACIGWQRCGLAQAVLITGLVLHTACARMQQQAKPTSCTGMYMHFGCGCVTRSQPGLICGAEVV